MIGIIGALSKELDLIKENIQNTKEKNILGSEFVSGKIFGEDVVIAECSIGKVNAAITTATMINEYNPDIRLDDNIALVCDVLLDMTEKNRAAIMDEMSAPFAAKVTKRIYSQTKE